MSMIIPGFPTPMIAGGAVAPPFSGTVTYGTVSLTVGVIGGSRGYNPGQFGSIASNTLLILDGTPLTINSCISTSNVFALYWACGDMTTAQGVRDEVEANYTGIIVTGSATPAKTLLMTTIANEFVVYSSGIPYVNGLDASDVGGTFTVNWVV